MSEEISTAGKVISRSATFKISKKSSFIEVLRELAVRDSLGF